MSKLKQTMVKGMGKIMLTCDQATLLATQDSVDKIGCGTKFQLRLHLLGCKFCRTFVKQTKQITEQIDMAKKINPDELKLHLTVKQKEQLRHTVESNNK